MVVINIIGYNINMLEQTVPYPVELISSSSGDLERHLLNYPERGMFSFANLPVAIKSSSLEHYANWFGELTSKDPDNKERGASVYLRTMPRQLIYPRRLATGYNTVLLLTLTSNNIFPLASVHSHVQNTCFTSPILDLSGDLLRVITGYSHNKKKLFDIISLLATEKYNYLLLRTQDTPSVDDNKFIAESNAYFHSEDFIMSLYKYLINRYGEFILSGLDTYRLVVHSLCLFGTFHFAQQYRLGFYYSQKDGKYNRVTEQSLVEIMDNTAVQ